MNQNILEFIKSCVIHQKVLWTYHVNMRLESRSLSRTVLISSVNNFEIIEEYPNDKYLPSYLVYTKFEDLVFHIVVAVDQEHDNIRIVTAYKPTLDKWESDFMTRRKK